MYILKNLWFQTLMRQFFFNIDKIVFNLITKVYDLLVVIARTSPLSQGDISSMAGRIYRLLAIFMIFKVTFSLIMYVVNPDDFTEKSKGVGNLTKNIIISLALLILTPYIFRYAYQLQEIILEDNSLAVLILGDQGIENNFFSSAGEKMSFVAMQPFFVPDTSIDELYECTTLIDENGKFNSNCSGLDENYQQDAGVEKSLYSLIKKSDDFSEADLKNYVAGMEGGYFGLAFRENIAVATVTKKGPYIIDYSYFMSTAVGIVILLLLISFCMDIAVRSIKLAFLQLIAPIPIISYVDPKSGKDGMFKKWYKMCFSTFVSLFIRLLVIYFVVYIISKISSGGLVDVIDGSYVKSTWVSLFILVGALMFAKQFPKILESLGIKLDGGGKFTLNPLKKLENEAIGGKQIHNTARGIRGFGAGVAIGAVGAMSGAGIGRIFSGAASGAQAGMKGKKIGEIRKDQINKNAEMRRAIASGSTFKGRMGARVSSLIGAPGKLGEVEHNKIQTQNKIDNLQAANKLLQAEIAPSQRLISRKEKVKSSIGDMESWIEGQITGNKAGSISNKYRTLQTQQQYLQNNIGNKLTEDIDIGGTRYHAGDTITTDMAQRMSNDVGYFLKKQGKEELMNQYLSGNANSEIGVTDDSLEVFGAKLDAYKSAVAAHGEGISEFSTYNDIHKQTDTMDIEIQKERDSIAENQGKIEANDDNIKAYQSIIEEYNAQEKREKANIEATHSTAGGPANPKNIEPAKSTKGYTTGGPGSGVPPAATGYVPGGRPGPGPRPGGN